MIDIIPYFAGLITFLFSIAFALAITKDTKNK